MSNTKPTSKTPQKSHKARTFFSALSGIIAIYLILASITVVWLNRTLTDNKTYVSTVSPLVASPEVQTFVSQKVSEQLLNNAPLPDLAQSLLPASGLTVPQTDYQLKALLQPVIQANVQKVITSPTFATLWKNTNKSAQAALVQQLNSDSDKLTLDLSPTINGVIAQLETTQLAPVAGKITMSPDAGKLVVKSDGISRAHRYYKLYQRGTVAIIVSAILFLIASILLSTHHNKTVRRILFGTGILALLQGTLLFAPGIVKIPGADAVTQAAAHALAHALLHNLQIASFTLGILCLLGALGSKIYSIHQATATRKPA